MMRTSPTQFEVMVDFMERNGDLNKPAEGPNGRLTAIKLWQDLQEVLNLDTTGTPKPVDKWKKVWSDLKNNTKRKAAKVNKATVGTGGGPACKLTLTDLEQRVLQIIGPQAATGLITVEEVGIELVDPTQPAGSEAPVLEAPVPIQEVEFESVLEDWNRPGCSSHSIFQQEVVEGTATLPTPHHAQSPTRHSARDTARRVLRARRRSHASPAPPLHTRRSQHVDAASQFLASDEHWRNFATEFVTEHLRLREVELQQQSQWQTLFEKFINLLEIYINK